MVHAAIAEAAARRGARADDARAAPRSRSSATCSRRRRRAAASPRCSSTPRCATSRSSASSGCRSGRARCACAAPRRRVPGTIGEPVEVGGATIRQGDVVVLDADGAVVVEQRARRRGARRRPRARRARGRQAREARRRARSPTTSTGCAELVEAMTRRPLHDVARIGHAELLTPKPEESLRFFVDVLGMEEEAREGQSVYLRGWGDYLRYSLKLTESPQAGLGARRAARLEPGGARAARRGDRGDAGSARAGSTATSATARRTASPIPTATSSSSTTRPSATSRPSTCGRRWKNQPQRYVGRGAAVKRLDHVNVLAADVRANRVFAAGACSATASTSGSSSTTAPRRAPG